MVKQRAPAARGPWNVSGCKFQGRLVLCQVLTLVSASARKLGWCCGTLTPQPDLVVSGRDP